MKILLISPKITTSIKTNHLEFVDRERGISPPLNIMYLASYLLRYTNHKVSMFDAQIENKYPDGDFDIVGITVTTFTLLDILEEIPILRTKYPGCKIVVGGAHPTIYPWEMLKWVDYVIRGEGEQVLPILLNNLNTGQRIFACRENESNLDKFPFPLRTNTDKYNSIFSKGKSTFMITSRGCPYSCKFCFRPTIGRGVRYRSPENVLTEIDECLRMGIRDFQFYDDTFTVNKDRLLEICKGLKGLKIRFDVRSRVDTIDYNILRELKSVGMKQIRLGIESGVQRVLNRLGKGITIKETCNAFKICKELKIETVGYAMAGCPGETIDDIRETFNFIKELEPNFIHFSIFTPYPATEIYREWVEKNQEDVWLEFAKDPRVIDTPVWGDIPRDTLEKMVMDFYKNFYIRPSYILKTIWKNPTKYFNAGRRLLKI